MLISVSNLITKSWQDYTKNLHEWMLFAALMFAPSFILVLAGSFLGFLSVYAPALTGSTDLIVLVLLALSVVVGFWSSLALTHAAGTFITKKQTDHWKEHYAAALPLLWPALVTGAFVTIAVTFGVILFIIPGIIFLGWYFFAGYRVIFENESGFKALRESKKMMFGRWWAVAWRLVVGVTVFSFLFSLAIFVVGVAVNFLPVSEDLISVVTIISHLALSSIFLIPTTTLVVSNLYFSLRENPVSSK